MVIKSVPANVIHVVTLLTKPLILRQTPLVENSKLNVTLPAQRQMLSMLHIVRTVSCRVWDQQFRGNRDYPITNPT